MRCPAAPQRQPLGLMERDAHRFGRFFSVAECFQRNGLDHLERRLDVQIDARTRLRIRVPCPIPGLTHHLPCATYAIGDPIWGLCLLGSFYLFHFSGTDEMRVPPA